MRRSALALLAAGAVAGAVVARRRVRRGAERVDLYYEDGSMVSLEPGSADAERLVPIARDLLAAAG